MRDINWELFNYSLIIVGITVMGLAGIYRVTENTKKMIEAGYNQQAICIEYGIRWDKGEGSSK